MKTVKISCWLLGLLFINFASLGDRWYCGVCHKIHKDACSKPLLTGRMFYFSEFLGDIKTKMEDLDAKSRVIVILRLMYSHVKLGTERNIYCERLKSFSYEIWRCVATEEQVFKRSVSDFDKISTIFKGLLAYYIDRKDLPYKYIDNAVSNILQCCSWNDLKEIRNVLKKYDGPKYDAVEIMRLVGNTLGIRDIYEGIETEVDDEVGLKLDEEVDCVDLFLSKVQYLLDVIEFLQGPSTDESEPDKIFSLMESYEFKIEQIVNTIGDFLEKHKYIFPETIIERLIQRYAFSLGAIVPCYFLPHWMSKGYVPHIMDVKCLNLTGGSDKVRMAASI